MNKKILLYVAAIVGGGIGSYIPTLFGDVSLLSGWSIFGGLIGGIAGIWLGVKLSQNY